MASPLFALGATQLLLNQVLFNYRRAFGDDGSDQMNTVVVAVLALCVGPHSTAFLLDLGLWFLAAQACLAYCAAGISKLVSPMWRSGEAVYRIFNTATYGTEAIASVLRDRRGLNVFLCWSVIMIETLFPLALVAPTPITLAFLVWGALFHAQCAAIMGLNSFLWAFLSTYPAVFFAHSQLPMVFGGLSSIA